MKKWYNILIYFWYIENIPEKYINTSEKVISFGNILKVLLNILKIYQIYFWYIKYISNCFNYLKFLQKSVRNF